jgi:hypothetical protein
MRGNDGCMYISSKVGQQKVHNWKPVDGSCSPAARRRSASSASPAKKPASPSKASPSKKHATRASPSKGSPAKKHAKHSSPSKRCEKGMMLNPATNRCVKKDGAVGRRLRGM